MFFLTVEDLVAKIEITAHSGSGDNEECKQWLPSAPGLDTTALLPH